MLRSMTRWRRRLLVGAFLTAGLGAGTWIAIHEVPGFGPALADGVRAVVGPAPVAWAEDVAYGAADMINTATRANEAPKTFWDVPEASAQEMPTAASSAEVAAPSSESGPPRFAAPFEKVATPVDGVWVPIQAPGDPGPAVMWKSLVHPDEKRPFAAVAVVAFELAAVEVHLAAGTDEPKSLSVPRAGRTGLIPDALHADLLAAFNGGFKAMHGNYGMRIGADTFIPPRDIACTVGVDASGAMVVRTFKALATDEARLSWWRQTPPCLVEEGEPNPGLLHEFNKNWGATVGGDTIIRRSALGVSKDGKFAYYALGDAVTAQSIGRAMQAVGAHGAAQLDVNYSYPRFLVFERGAGGPTATQPIIPDIKYTPAEYVRAPSSRDFFFLTRRRGAR
jgi:hypothetical protein